jgi:hypothetical protein
MVVSVADREALAAIEAVAPGRLVYLNEPGREGLFRCVTAGSAPADPLGGLYIPARQRGLGWARVWDGTHGRAEWFGARINDGNADCADALEACHALCPVMQLGQADYFVRRTVRFGHYPRQWSLRDEPGSGNADHPLTGGARRRYRRRGGAGQRHQAVRRPRY